MSCVTRSVTICNAGGLHARPAMQFVDMASGFESAIVVHKEADGTGEPAVTVDGKSVMEMITLEALEGTLLRIEATGSDADKAVEQLAGLVESRFGED